MRVNDSGTPSRVEVTSNQRSASPPLQVESSLSSSNSTSCFTSFFRSISNFFSWFFRKIFCMTPAPREITPIPKEIDEFWNKRVQYHWATCPVIESGKGHFSSDHFALACKLEGIKECRFNRIFIQSNTTIDVWFTSESLEGYGELSQKAKAGDFNNTETLFIQLGNTHEPLYIIEYVKEKFPFLKNACFYYLSEAEWVQIRDQRTLPDHLKEFLTRR